MNNDIAGLLELAREVYGNDGECAARLDAQAERLREPLRVALAGPAGSGKSTLLGAILGGEGGGPMGPPRSTKLVTWFRYGEAPRVTVHLEGGVRHLEVQWPREVLRDLTLIDTPGTGSSGSPASRRAREFLLPEGGPAAADVIVYVARDPSDLELLRAQREASAGLSGGVSAVLVLGRADEVAGGRIDSLLAARSLAERWSDDPEVRSLAVTTVPVAGLLAHGARTLREADLGALTKVAALGRSQRERITASVGAFLARGPELDLTGAQRAALLDRFGLFGVRLAAVLLAGGTTGAADLSRELALRSGIDDLLAALEGLRARSGFLKADAALALVEGIVRLRPRAEGTADVEVAIERARASSHDLRELRVLASIPRSALPADLKADVTRLLGGRGTSPAHRLDVVEPTALDRLADLARDEVGRWRALAEDDRSDPEVAGIARVVVRSAEGMLDELAG